MKLSSFSILFFAWIIATISMLGSLFFSEVMEFQPCILCWYQRIAMYPLVPLLLVGALHAKEYTSLFCGPLVLIGWLIALYHNLLHYEIVPESASPCMEGVSCSAVYIELAGFITIPIMSLVAFSLIGCALIQLKRTLPYEE